MEREREPARRDAHMQSCGVGVRALLAGEAHCGDPEAGEEGGRRAAL